MFAVVRNLAGETFASLSVRNYRLYFIGIGFSFVGSWMHAVAFGWLTLSVTGSGTALGGVLALRYAPMLLGGLYGGSIVDRLDKRYLLFATQTFNAVIALTLAAFVFFGAIEVWMVYAAALLFGIADVIDRPARQTFLHEMTGSEHLRNAVSLNSIEANLARAVGPMIAGVVIASVGIAACFFVNALSYVALIIALLLMRVEELRRAGAREQAVHLLSGVQYAASVPLLRTLLIAMAVIGTLSYEFQTSLPLLAQKTFLGGAADYAALLSAMGAGSVAGGLFSASRKKLSVHEFVAWAFSFGVSILATSLAPTLGFAIVGMVFVGFFSINLSSAGNTMLQLEAAAHMRGRVMALWSMALFGSTVIGAPIVGFFAEYVSPRAGLALGGLAAIFAALFAGRRLLTGHRLFSIPAFISIRRDEDVSEEGTKV